MSSDFLDDKRHDGDVIDFGGATKFRCGKEPGHEGPCEWKIGGESYLNEVAIQWKKRDA